ncbi:MAG TPA: FAD-binding protein, partial [Candidatus Binatia bacterium]|nr:FAD-binding protein [Candidatus Binatia bacterium]
MDGDSKPPPPGHEGAFELDAREPTAHDAVDGVMPARVVRVHSVADAVEIIRFSTARRQPLIIRGGGTRLTVGNPPRALESILAMDTMARVLAYS